jgi:ribosome biogenesis GTPase / thiamine phosphate phosphatase
VSDRAIESDARVARVARVDFASVTVVLEDGAEHDATVRGRLMGRSKALGNTVVVGDEVSLAFEAGRPVIVEVAPRRNSFSRRASGERRLEQVVAANLDQVVVVASFDDPPFKPGFVDRVLGQAEHLGLPARLVLNKTDLGSPEAERAIVADYERAGFAGHLTCALRGDGVESLRHACVGRRSLFVGHSGVGKSSLLNALSPGLGLVAGAVNTRTGKGKHTTTAAWLLCPAPGLELIDTPGVRSFALWGISSRDLEQAYPEFRRHLGACRFNDCRHVSEPGCAVRDAVAAGEIAARRYDSFLKLREELIEEERGR